MLDRNQHEYFLSQLKEGKIYCSDVPDELLTEDFCIDLIKVNIREARELPPERWTERFCEHWINNGQSVGNIPRIQYTEKIVQLALIKSPSNIQYIPNDYENLITEDVCLAAFANHAYLLKYFPKKFTTLFTEERCLAALRQEVSVFFNIPEEIRRKHKTLASYVVQRAPRSILRLSDEEATPDLWLQAIHLKLDIIKSIPEKLLTIQMIDDIAKEWSVSRFIEYIPKNLLTEELCLHLAKKDFNLNLYINVFPVNGYKNPEMIYLTMVKTNWRSLECVPIAPVNFRIESICLEACKNNGLALEFVPNKIFSLCEVAVKIAGDAIQFVPDEYKEKLCILAIKQNGYALRFIPEYLRSKELCNIAVENSPYAIQFVPKDIRTESLCLAAVKKDGMSLKSIPQDERTLAICNEAVKQNVKSYKFVPMMHLTHDMLLLVVSQNGLFLKDYFDLDLPCYKFMITASVEFQKNIFVAAVKQNPLALQWVPEHLKSEIIDAVSVEYILTKKFNAINYFPTNKDYTDQLNDFLKKIQYITVKANEDDKKHELLDSELVYCSKEKRQGKIISISDSEKPVDDLKTLLSLMKNGKINHPLSIAFIGHANENSIKLADVHFNEMAGICKEYSCINNVTLLGCKTAQAKNTKQEKEMISTYKKSKDKTKDLKYGLISTINADNSKTFYDKCIKFCKSHQLDGVYIVNKINQDQYQLIAFKLVNPGEYTEYQPIKTKKIEPTQLDNIDKILDKGNKKFPFPKMTGEIRAICQNPLSHGELTRLRQLTYKHERFDPAHPKYKEDKTIYPFLATIRAESNDLHHCLLKKLADAIDADKDITWEITLTGPTKAAHVDTAKRKFVISRAYLFNNDYNSSFFASGSTNLVYDRLKGERKKDIDAMSDDSKYNQITSAKKITITTKRKQ